jgi:hypothetical protein
MHARIDRIRCWTTRAPASSYPCCYTLPTSLLLSSPDSAGVCRAILSRDRVSSPISQRCVKGQTPIGSHLWRFADAVQVDAQAAQAGADAGLDRADAQARDGHTASRRCTGPLPHGVRLSSGYCWRWSRGEHQQGTLTTAATTSKRGWETCASAQKVIPADRRVRALRGRLE